MNNLAFSLYFLISAVLMSLVSSSQTANDFQDIARIKNGVRSKRISSYDRTGDNRDNIKIKAGQKRIIADIQGSGIINHIWITMSPEPDKLSRNDVLIRMFWDGNVYPSVESPIGPFFGQGWEENYEFTSALLLATPINGMGLVSYFPMPFAKSAKIEIENQSGADINAFYYYIDYLELHEPPIGLGRFHAWYNRQITEPADSIENEHWMFGENQPNKDGHKNYLIADIKGKGHFVGLNYYVHSPTPFWYGEGDDMIFIDGDEQSTLHGTGTEDYFNTSWGAPKAPYSTPYFGYARITNETGFLGRTHIYRFNLADPIYFDKSLKFSIEHGSNNVLTLDLASVAYWYLDTATAVPPILNKDKRKPSPMINIGDIHRWRTEWRKNRGNIPGLWNK